MSVATDASFSFKRSEGACGMANSLPPGGRVADGAAAEVGWAGLRADRGEPGFVDEDLVGILDVGHQPAATQRRTGNIRPMPVFSEKCFDSRVPILQFGIGDHMIGGGRATAFGEVACCQFGGETTTRVARQISRNPTFSVSRRADPVTSRGQRWYPLRVPSHAEPETGSPSSASMYCCPARCRQRVPPGAEDAPKQLEADREHR